MFKHVLSIIITLLTIATSALFTIIIINPATPIVQHNPELLRLATSALAVALVLLGVVNLISFWHNRRQVRRSRIGEFSVFKSIGELSPEDFRLSTHLDLFDGRSLTRPYNATYIPRHYIPAMYGSDNNSPAVADQDLIEILRDPYQGIAIIGSPLEGKTRSVFEVLKQLPDDYLVVAPHRAGVTPSAEAIGLTRGRSVVVVLDDVYDFVSYQFDLRQFLQELNDTAIQVALIGTSRNGEELRALQSSVRGSSLRVVENLRLLQFVPLQRKEKQALASSVGREWNRFDENRLPTPGSIVMDEALQAMATRFRGLGSDAKTALRCIQVMAAAGMTSFTPEAVMAVGKYFFGWDMYLGRLTTLAEDLVLDGFLRSFSRDVWIPEFAYIRDESVISYGLRNLETDTKALPDAFIASEDLASLKQLAAAASLTRGPGRALQIVDACLEIVPDDQEARATRAMMLLNADRFAEAMEASKLIEPRGTKTFIQAKIYEGMELYEDAIAGFDILLNDVRNDNMPNLNDAPEDAAALTEFAYNAGYPHVLLR